MTLFVSDAYSNLLEITITFHYHFGGQDDHFELARESLQATEVTLRHSRSFLDSETSIGETTWKRHPQVAYI